MLSQNSRRMVPEPPVPWGTKLAVTDVLLRILIVIGLVCPEAAPVQPAKSLPVAGTAVSVTDVPPAYVVLTGFLVTVPEPFTLVVSVYWTFGLPIPAPSMIASSAA